MPTLQVAIDARQAVAGAGQFNTATQSMSATAAVTQAELQRLDGSLNSLGGRFGDTKSLTAYQNQLQQTISTIKNKLSTLEGGAAPKMDLFGGEVGSGDIDKLNELAAARERVRGGNPSDVDISLLQRMKEGTDQLTEAQQRLLEVNSQIAAQKAETTASNANVQLEADTVSYGKKAGTIKGGGGLEDEDLASLKQRWDDSGASANRASGGVDRFGRSVESMGGKLPAGMHGLSRLFSGFGMLFIASEAAGRSVAEFDKALAKVEERGAPLTLGETAAVFEDITAAAAKSIPIFGQFFALGQKIGSELFGGASEIRKNTREAKAQDDAANKQVANTEAVRGHKEALAGLSSEMEKSARLREAQRSGGDEAEEQEKIKIATEDRLKTLQKEEDAVIRDKSLSNEARQELYAKIDALKEAATAEGVLQQAEAARVRQAEKDKKTLESINNSQIEVLKLLGGATDKYDQSLNDLDSDTRNHVTTNLARAESLNAINEAVRQGADSVKSLQEQLDTQGMSEGEKAVYGMKQQEQVIQDQIDKLMELQEAGKKSGKWSDSDQIMNDYVLNDAWKKLGKAQDATGRATALSDSMEEDAYYATVLEKEQNLAEEIAKIRINGLEDEHQKRLLLLEMDRAKELTDAEKTGADRALINEKYSLLKEQMTPEPDKRDYAGMFSGVSVQSLDSRYTGYAQAFASQASVMAKQLQAIEKTVAASERTAKAMEQVNAALARAGINVTP